MRGVVAYLPDLEFPAGISFADDATLDRDRQRPGTSRYLWSAVSFSFVATELRKKQKMSENKQVHPYQLLDIDERVKRVLLNTPLADGHNDLPQQLRCCFQGKIHNNPKFDLEKGFQRGMTDLPRLKKGAVGLQFWSICVPHLRGSEDFALPEYNDMCRDAIEQIDLSIRMVKQYPKDFELVFGPENVREIYQKSKIACSIGLEGLHQAGNSISVIRAYHQLGVRYVSTLPFPECARLIRG